MEHHFSLSRILVVLALVGAFTYHFKYREKPEEEETQAKAQTTRTVQAPKVAPMRETATASAVDLESAAGPTTKPSLVSSVISRVTTAIGLEESEEETPDQELSAGLAIKDPELDLLLEESFQAIFLRKVGTAFTRRKNGESSTAIQLTGLQLAAPINARLTKEEREQNIQERIFFPVEAEAWREYYGEFWGDWNPSKPPMLSGFTFEKREGSWVVLSTPSQWYSLQ